MRQSGKGHKGPQYNGDAQYDGARLFDILPGPGPGMNKQPLEGRHSIWRQLHDKRGGFTFYNRASQQPGNQQGTHPGADSYKKHDQGLPGSKKGSNQKRKNRQLGPTVHEWHGKQGGQPFPG